MKKTNVHAIVTASTLLASALGVVGCGSGNSSSSAVTLATPVASVASSSTCNLTQAYPGQCLSTCSPSAGAGGNGIVGNGYVLEYVTAPNTSYCEQMQVVQVSVGSTIAINEYPYTVCAISGNSISVYNTGSSGSCVPIPAQYLSSIVP
ncbi:MAG: hypothetical protein P4M08_15390 [Oligoflexia bacterium]|nr:hypothetical protein [Oligoflexia bacterium]